MTRTHSTTALFIGAMICLASCGPDFSDKGLGERIEMQPSTPTPELNAAAATPYTGANELVLTAQERYRTGLDLHRKIITRTCTPNGGVCHNRKEYPDLHTPANFVATIGAACNVQPGQETAVYDGCERSGDRFRLSAVGGKEIEIGYIDYIPGEPVDFRKEKITPDAMSVGLHIYLHDPVQTDREEQWGDGQFIRTFVREDGDVADLVFGTYTTRWWILDGGTHLVGEVQSYQRDRVTELLSVGIIQGDLNRNGTYGARAAKPLQMIEPGNPESSYLIARLRGRIGQDQVPGSRMPLANQPLDISEMLALFCFVEGLKPTDQGAPNLNSPIDYKSCSYSSDPENLNLLGEGVTWERRVKKVLQANCGGCHGGVSPAEGLDLNAPDAYEKLLAASKQRPELKLIEPGDPAKSYLWLKISGDEQIEGLIMPIDPLNGERRLREAELSDIKTWIENGAVENE